MRFLNTFSHIKKATCHLLTVLLFASACSTKHYAEPLTPEQALKSFKLNNDFNIEIFTTEPFVQDPVDMYLMTRVRLML